MSEKDSKEGGAGGVSRDMYRSQTKSKFSDEMELLGRRYVKVDDLRYGTNPHQGASLYRPADADPSTLVIGGMEILKTGKSGLSATNYGDLKHGLNIVKYMEQDGACAILKHLNACGVRALNVGNADPTLDVFKGAFNGDPVAAYGGVAVFNCEVDVDTAAFIMDPDNKIYIEAIGAPAFSEKAMAVFTDPEPKCNKDIRIVRFPVKPTDLPKWIGDDAPPTLTVLNDGCVIVEETLLTGIRGIGDFKLAGAKKKDESLVVCERQPTKWECDGMLFGWYVNMSTRSNGVVIANGWNTLAVGTGQQDRVRAVRQAIEKAREFHLDKLEGAVLVSDGFLPFKDSVDACAESGIKGIAQPGGSIRDAECIEACNEHGISMVFTGERIFSHH